MELALQAASLHDGQTAPNPPVGAVIAIGNTVLGVGAHKAAGTPHAEVVAIENAKTYASKNGLKLKDATLFVTLEPCNHTGKTPPCTQAVLEAGLRKICIGTMDPNPNVAGGGAKFLSENGVSVDFMPDSKSADELIDGFRKFSATRTPYVTHKIAVRNIADGFTMLPDLGKKTFAGETGLVAAHRERRRSDAIITTVDTVLSDLPEFTVRKMNDHSEKRRKRVLGIVSSRARPLGLLPKDWLENAKENGFDVLAFADFESALHDLGMRQCLRVLVEAGPRFSAWLAETNLWDEQLWILAGQPNDSVFRKKRIAEKEAR